jgi:hypothetical protein
LDGFLGFFGGVGDGVFIRPFKAQGNVATH